MSPSSVPSTRAALSRWTQTASSLPSPATSHFCAVQRTLCPSPVALPPSLRTVRSRMAHSCRQTTRVLWSRPTVSFVPGLVGTPPAPQAAGRLAPELLAPVGTAGAPCEAVPPARWLPRPTGTPLVTVRSSPELIVLVGMGPALTKSTDRVLCFLGR